MREGQSDVVWNLVLLPQLGECVQGTHGVRYYPTIVERGERSSLDPDQGDIMPTSFLTTTNLRSVHLVINLNKVVWLVVETRPDSGVSCKTMALGLWGVTRGTVTILTPFFPHLCWRSLP